MNKSKEKKKKVTRPTFEFKSTASPDIRYIQLKADVKGKVIMKFDKIVRKTVQYIQGKVASRKK